MNDLLAEALRKVFWPAVIGTVLVLLALSFLQPQSNPIPDVAAPCSVIAHCVTNYDNHQPNQPSEGKRK